MKTLNNFPSGGFKLYSDDLRFMNEITKEAFEMITSSLCDGEQIIILKGCKISQNGVNTTVSDGIIFFNGEIMSFAAQTFATPLGSNYAYWSLDILPLKTRNFQAGNPVDVYQDRVLKIEVGPSIPFDSQSIFQTKEYWSLINDNIIHPPIPDVFEYEIFFNFIAFRLTKLSPLSNNNFICNVEKPGMLEMIAFNNDRDINIVSLGDSAPIGTIYHMRFQKTQSHQYDVKIMLNSSAAGSLPKIVQYGSGGATELNILTKTYKFIRTYENWELME